STLVVRWQRKDGAWMQRQEDNAFVFPPGASKLVLPLNVTSQLTKNDGCWFDNVALHPRRMIAG
ncbi:MAG: hypothetical protein N2689_16430, partial [Verrucomicrobiae bacterium]|nr:hypothetical protein [Verrucomicrobiae bacterium]